MSRHKRSKLPVLTYTCKHDIKILVGFDPARNWIKGRLPCFFTLYGISSSDEKENSLLGEEGKYVCWDGEVTISETEVVILGADAPSGGIKNKIKIIIPKKRLVGFEISNF